jgi:hypothetical protein
MDGRVLQLPRVDGEPIIDFPVFAREDWLSLDKALTWDQACKSIGVTRSQLRRALDAAKEHAGPAPLNVEGTCKSVRFHAERPSATRGVAWRFYLHRDTKSAGTRMADLRHHVHYGRTARVRSLAGKVLIPFRWARHPFRRAS